MQRNTRQSLNQIPAILLLGQVKKAPSFKSRFRQKVLMIPVSWHASLLAEETRETEQGRLFLRHRRMNEGPVHEDRFFVCMVREL